jgi:predicted nucleic acid-binding protein
MTVEIQAERLLIDERRGRLVASRLNLRYMGILGILVEAKSQGLIVQVKPLLNALIDRTGFWITKPLYNRVLQMVDEDDSL